MHYQQYCKAQSMYHTSPLARCDFYRDLGDIAIKYSTVLSEIEQMRFEHRSMLYEVVARGLDIFLSLLGLISCVLPFLGIGLAIKINSPGPVFYRQRRVGKKGQIFQIFKFRTMFTEAESKTGPVWAVSGDPRQTHVGAFLRRTKLDELPQLFNVLKGELTFVGPRPERPEFVYEFVKYMPAFDRRHDVKPGITGLAQLRNGYDASAVHVYRKLRWDADLPEDAITANDSRHTGLRIEQNVRAQDAGDGAAGPECRQRRVGADQDVNDGADDAAKQIEDEKPTRPHPVFHVVAENPEVQHVPAQVEQTAMQEHTSEHGHDQVSGSILI